MFPKIEAQTQIQTPPKWATLERQLIDKMNVAGPQVMEKYTRPDGTLFWPTHPDFQSIDGLDDAYESFHNWSLFYMLGGDARFLTDADTEFDVITNDMARYGTGHGYPMVVKEYQPGFDGQQKRPGLPPDVGALVTQMTADTTELQLVNLNTTAPRHVIVQAGAMGEHNFTSVRIKDDRNKHSVPVNGTHLHVHLPPYTHIELELGMHRFVNAPSYNPPW